MSLTEKDKQVLALLISCTEKGIKPSMERVAKDVGYKSKSGVHKIIHRLEAMGYIDISYKPFKYKIIKNMEPSIESLLLRCKSSINAFSAVNTDQRYQRYLDSIIDDIDARIAIYEGI